MKSRPLIYTRHLLLLLASSLLASHSGYAATQYATGTFTWDDATAAWASGSGNPYTSSWINGNDAVLEGTAGTVTLSNPTVHNLTFNTTGYMLSGASTLTLNGSAPTLTLGTSITGTVSSIIGGTAGLTKAGTGTLTLSGSNTFSGTTTLKKGTLVLGGADGSISDTLSIYSSGILTLDNTAVNMANRLGNGKAFTSNGGVFNYTLNASSGSYVESIGTLTLNAGALTLNTTQAASGQTATLTLSSITRNAGGTLFFSGTGLGADGRNKNTFTTPPTLAAGIIPWALMHNGSTYDLVTISGNDLVKYTAYTTGAAGTSWSADTVNARPGISTSTGTLAAGGTVNSLVLDNTVNLTAGTTCSMTIGNGSTPGLIVQTGGYSSVGVTSARVTLAFSTREAIFNIASGGTLTINAQNANAIMTGTGGTTKTGPGTLMLGSDSGTTVGGNFTQGAMTGALNLNDGLYEIFCTQNNGLAFGDGINFNGGNLKLNAAGSGITFNKLTPLVTPIIVNADALFTLDNRSTAASAGVTHTFGTLTVNNSPNFMLTAGTNVVSGTQQLTVGATTLNSDATFTLNNSTGATMQVSVAAVTNKGNTVTLRGNGKLIQTGVWTGTGGLTLDSAYTGTATLSQANTFSGATAVNGGTLKLSTSTSLATATHVSIAGGGTFDVSALTASSGTYIWNSTSLSASGAALAATLAGTSGGTINMGSKPISLTYNGSSPSLTVSGATLSLGGNTFTVVVPGPALVAGTYTLVSSSAGISGSVNPTPLYTGGNGVAVGATGVVSMSGGSVILTVTSGSAIYTVTYDGNGNTSGTAPTDVNGPYDNDATVTVLENVGGLAKTGFVFSGWNTAANGSGTSYAASGSETLTMGSAHVILYAQWTSVTTYTVSYNGNGSTSGTVPTSGDYAAGSTVIVKANTGALTRSGYAFAGWNTAAGGGGTYYASGATFLMGAAPVILYAQWISAVTYTVTYLGNGSTGGGVPTDSGTYAAGSTVSVKANTGALIKTGYAFAGWNTAENGSGTQYAATGSATFAMGSANVILYAQWSVPYTVTYDGNGSTGGTVPTDSGTYAVGTTVIVKSNTGALVKTGFTFTGWNTQADGLGTGYAASGSSTFTMGSANVTLYAKWEVTYTVTYDGNGSTGGAVPVDSGAYAVGTTVIVKANTGALAKTDAVLSGWNTALNGSGTGYAASGSATFTMGAANVILYAQWAETSIYAYTINNSQVTITGYTGPGGVVNIPDTINGMPVIRIGSYAFYMMSSLTSVTIPSGVTSIGDRAFLKCTGLTGITIPSSVTNLGSWAFQSCTSLTGVTLPNGITRIGESTFDSCTKLVSVTLSTNLSSIGDWAFYNCAKLTGVTIPANVTSIGNWAFKSCAALTGVTLPAGISNIANGVFESCAGLTSVTIPVSVTNIGNAAFCSCTSLTGMTLPNGVTRIGDWAFASCVKLASVTIPASVTYIGERAFDSCTILTGITLPANVTNIWNGTFDSCAALPSVTIPTRVTTIGDWTFASCVKLTGVTIPDGVASIGNGAFEACTNLASVTIPASVTNIGAWAFYACSKLTGITIPVSVTRIGDWAFASCINLTGATLPSYVISLGDGAFASCTKLIRVTIPSSVTRIGDWAFYSCTGLTGVYFKGDAPTLDSGVFDLATNAKIYYSPSATGWPTPPSTLFAGRTVIAWSPHALSDASFGIAANHFGFNINGTSGMIVVVEASTDLVNWSPLQTISLTGDSFSFSDPDLANNHVARFYRFIMP